jgi:adenylosuccinate synthase
MNMVDIYKQRKIKHMKGSNIMIDVREGHKGNVTVVLDSQAGSCGKGKFIGYLSKKDNIEVAVDNFMSNAGHTWVDNNGNKVMTQHLPTSIVNKNTVLVIGPGAAITPHILFEEMVRYHDMIGDRKIIINPRAVVITDEHRYTEERVLRSGSTFKGCGAAQADKVMRQAMLFGEWWNKFTGDYDFGDESEFSYCIHTGEYEECIKDHIVVMDTMNYINDAIDNGHSVIVEGSQGCDLDINYGLDYPNTTSRQCHAGQLLADCGISPTLVDDIIMIMRPYPIRISNTTNLTDGKSGGALITSSGDYSGSEEITWDTIKKRCGAPDDVILDEKTTVTKKTRRVFEMNWDRLKYVTKLNRPTQIALNFVQYLDWKALHATSYNDLPDAVRSFILKVEEVTGVPVTLIGTGARDCDTIDIRRK